MRNALKRWMDMDDILGAREAKGRFSRRKALKVKRELRRLAYY